MPDLIVQEKQIKPQKGFQQDFLSSPADITIGGGMAGVGKSWCLQVAPVRHKDVYGFNCITFRRTMEQIKNPGSLWDKSMELYPMFGFKANEHQRTWTKKKLGITLKYSHLQYEKDIYSHDGSEYCLICFDELQHFTKKQFFYLLSRNRSTCGVQPYVLASCNPDPDSFLAEFLEWWIDQRERLEDGGKNPNWGFPIKERIGKLRYLIVYEDKYIWGDSKEEILENHYDLDLFQNEIQAGRDPKNIIKSVTFITGSIFDNKELLDKNPGYLANLNALDEIEKLRLLYGNWKIRAVDKCLFSNEFFDNVYTNKYPQLDRTTYITCDAARFGRDLATIWTWIGTMCVRLDILTTSSQLDMVKVIEKNRVTFGVTKSNCMVDQDGVGGNVVKLGKYTGFSGNDKPIPVPELRDENGNKKRENYFNLKTQLSYKWAERCNNGEVTFQLNDGSIYVDGYHGTKIKIDGVVHDVRDLIIRNYRAIREKDVDSESKKRINDKIEQKRILNGMSPDFYDGSFIREYYELKNHKITIGNAAKTQVRPSGESILDRL